MMISPYQSPIRVTAIVLCVTIAAAVAAINGCGSPPIDIFAEDLPVGVTGVSYATHLDADRSSTDWAIIEGGLPPGLSISNGGDIVGVPQTPGTFTFTARTRSTKDLTRTGEQEFTILVLEHLTLTAELPLGHRSDAFSYTPTVAGGTTPYAFTIIGLPAGIDYDRATGRIFGTPAAESAKLTIEINVSDAGTPQQTATQRVDWKIKAPGVAITTPSLPGGKVGAAYSATVEVVDGVSPYTFSIIGGLLPDGLHLSRTTGVISGTPTTAQTATITVQVYDSDTTETIASQDYSIEIAP